MMDWGSGGMMGEPGLGVFGMFFAFFFMLLLIVGTILLIVWIVKQFAPGGAPTPVSSSNALDILKERFAKGEISKEEFSVMKKELLK